MSGFEWHHNNWEGTDVEKMNELAKSGNTFLNCCFYEYKEGPAPQLELRKAGVRATYRKWLGYCQHCGHSYSEHYEVNSGNSQYYMPCGFPLIDNPQADKLNRIELVIEIGGKE